MSIIKVIGNISFSIEPDSISHINEKYIYIGLQDYRNQNQKNGFSLINILIIDKYRKLLKAIKYHPFIIIKILIY